MKNFNIFRVKVDPGCKSRKKHLQTQEGKGKFL